MKKGKVDRCYQCHRRSPNPEQLRVIDYSPALIGIECTNCGKHWDVITDERDCSDLEGFAEAKEKYDHSPKWSNQVWR